MQALLPEISEEEACRICARRLLAPGWKVAPEAFDDLLQMEEAADFLDRDDCKLLKREGETVKSRSAELQEYRAAVLAKRQKISGGAGSRSGARGAKGPPGPKLRVPAKGIIPHEEAKSLAPPGSFVWRALTEGAWCGRLPPNGERSRSWRRHGERGACLQILRLLWQQWADSQGLPLSEVPVAGLFEESAPDGPASSAAAANAASSSAAPEAAESQHGGRKRAKEERV